jgi:glycosyltransferase involved in cell wall biosynthesis
MPRSVSVIVCTRDRPQDLRNALPAILATNYRDFELVVVDQSVSDETAEIVAAAAAHDPRVRHVRDRGKGLSRARNIGINETRHELIVFTDDDCEPDAEWLGTIVQALEEDGTAAAAFGSVIPAPCDPRDGFIVGYLPKRRQRLTGRLAKMRDAGIGANMAFRRQPLLDTGMFDEMLGAGGYFASMEDQEITYRLLRAGHAVLHVPESRVLHHGLRDWKSGSPLMRKTYVAVAAGYMKYARVLDFGGVCLLLHEIRLAVMNVLDSAIHLRRPLGLGRLAYLFVGMWRSFELEVEPRNVIYRDTTSAKATR